MSKRAKTSHVGTNEALERTPRVDVAVSFLKPALPASGGDVPALVRLTGVLEQDAVVRAPLDVALVLDSSGSMHGEPMTFAIQATHDAIDLLEVGDRVSIITFSSRANVVVPLQTIEENRTALHAAVETIRAHGGTALHAGWATGANMLAEASEPGRFARVVLLTDGHANVGTTDPTVIAMEVAQLRARGITTSTVGLGRQFTEDLLASMSEAGDGRFAFAEVASEVQPIMAAELIGVDATVGRNVRLRFQDRSARGALTQVLNDLPVDGDATVVPDLVADMPFDLVGVVRVQSGTPLEGEHLGDLDLTWTGPDGTTQARCVPVIANLVGPEAYDAMEANSDVLAAYAAIAVSRHRKDAVAALDRGDHAAVMSALTAIDTLLQDAPETRAIQRERVAVDRIRQAVQRGDEVLGRKRLLFEEQRSRRGFRFEELEESHRYNEKEAILRDRRAKREAGARAAAAAATPARAESEASDDPTQKPAFATLQVPRADGTTAEIRLGLGDLTHAAVDAIVNPTNPQLFGQGPSVDGAVHRRGGRALTRACQQIAPVEVGQTVVTDGYELPARYVLHTVSPAFDGSQRTVQQLDSCYRTSLDLARQMRLGRVAFPAIGIGNNRVPPALAVEVALKVLLEVLGNPDAPTCVDLVTFDVVTCSLYMTVMSEVRTQGSAHLAVSA